MRQWWQNFNTGCFRNGFVPDQDTADGATGLSPLRADSRSAANFVLKSGLLLPPAFERYSDIVRDSAAFSLEMWLRPCLSRAGWSSVKHKASAESTGRSISGCASKNGVSCKLVASCFGKSGASCKLVVRSKQMCRFSARITYTTAQGNERRVAPAKWGHDISLVE